MAVPDRDDVSERWVKLIRREVTREEIHAWAKPWVEERSAEITDPMVRLALMNLHGFDMVYVEPGANILRHGGPGKYAHSESALEEAFDRWRLKCRESPAT